MWNTGNVKVWKSMFAPPFFIYLFLSRCEVVYQKTLDQGVRLAIPTFVWPYLRPFGHPMPVWPYLHSFGHTSQSSTTEHNIWRNWNVTLKISICLVPDDLIAINKLFWRKTCLMVQMCHLLTLMHLPMTEYEPQISSVRTDLSATWAETTALWRF